MNLELIASVRCFEGEQRRYSHWSEVLSCAMNFSVYMPPQALGSAAKNDLPVLYWLSGLTCTDENFVHKAGAQRLAAQLGLVLVAPDTSPRGEGVATAPDGAWDLGLGAGFYVNACQNPWRKNYHMYDYIVEELPSVIESGLPVSQSRRAISGHSMGGHGALVIGLRNSMRYSSVSAFAPIVAPSQCAWGEKAFSHYLGDDRALWQDYDASALIERAERQLPILIDQGDADQFLASQLQPTILLDKAKRIAYPLRYQLRPGYDHSYFYIASFIDEHLHFHASHLFL